MWPVGISGRRPDFRASSELGTSCLWRGCHSRGNSGASEARSPRDTHSPGSAGGRCGDPPFSRCPRPSPPASVQREAISVSPNFSLLSYFMVLTEPSFRRCSARISTLVLKLRARGPWGRTRASLARLSGLLGAQGSARASGGRVRGRTRVRAPARDSRARGFSLVGPCTRLLPGF